MRNSLKYCLAAALAVGAISLSVGSAFARTYSEEEYKCVAKALWFEYGSTAGKRLKKKTEVAREELRLIAHSIVVRGQASHWYNRKDWGGPNLCDVIKKKTGGVCQYSYMCTSAVREQPIPGNLWETLIEAITAPIKSVIETTKEKAADIKAMIQQNLTDREKWEEVKRAARDPLKYRGTKQSAPPPQPWDPPQQYAATDTYQESCSEPAYYADTCDERIVSGPRSKCYFALEGVLLERGQLPAGRRHTFYRRVPIGEVRGKIREEQPATCT